jgi:hypothetical protein
VQFNPDTGTKAGKSGTRKGVPNKLTEQARKLIGQALQGQGEKMEASLSSLAETNPKAYLEIMVKFFGLRTPPPSAESDNTAMQSWPKSDFSSANPRSNCR